ncbi:hypothetical protein MACH26_02070 [Planctobacterium marinum]|uniref:PABS domain-containing protein n=1 Tax=Planctobacterium marinum TaxID=1631968 RepID=A0AA48HE67_9ALTE|nr:hypothetical protein MACH26_02070 [Planctobacterium marinum]
MSIDDAVQSVMDLRTPWQPILPHLSALLLCFYYLPAPKQVMELGLGGGSLQRFFRYHFPKVNLLSVEYSSQVIALFKQWFNQGYQDYQVLHQDARYAIKEASSQDLIFIDLFAKQGTPDFVFTEEFYLDCARGLNPEGLLAINLISGSHLQSELVLDILRTLNLNFRVFSVPGYQNKIVFACYNALPAIRYDSNLEHLARRYGLNLNAIVALA